MTPKTPLGKVVASFSAVCGIMMLALPLGVIANNFGEYEKFNVKKNKILKILEENDVPIGSFKKNKIRQI
jgi:hypothetical protein